MADDNLPLNENSETKAQDANKPEPEISPIDEAKKYLEEAKKERILMTEERKRIEKATAEMLVNGRTFAGQTPPKPKEITPKDYAQQVMKGEINPFSES